MAYQVLARKWRPQRFDEVVGQAAVTRTLQNALTSGRLAQAFVFAGPRGVGKTTTARILARALNCAKGPTADPCGECDACLEIAQGRDIDVLEIDAATHTQVETVRDVIISGLAMMPVRNRYKVFLIDEVQQLSNSSFNALLKSIEEPPPHVVFMMATTELEKIPETVRSRSQIYEFRSITVNAIADQLRKIAAAEQVSVPPEALLLIARNADGSLRDAESAFDQVMAFAGTTISNEDVSTVLGLIGRDLLLEIATAAADENAPAAFELAARAVDLGYDLRLLCSELSRLVRDLLVLSVDRSRAADPEIAPEGERERLLELAGRFSREDLLRAFDVLARAELEIRSAAQPRYHLEMALLRWIHLRKLLPIDDLIQQLDPAGSKRLPGEPRLAAPDRGGAVPSGPAPSRLAPSIASRLPAPVQPAPEAARQPGPARSGSIPPPQADAERGVPTGTLAPAPVAERRATASSTGAGETKDAFLSEIKKTKASFYGMVIAQAKAIEFADDRITFTFAPIHQMLRTQLDQNREWLEALAAKVAGRPVSVSAVQKPPTSAAASEGSAADNGQRSSTPADLKAEALADPGVQAMLEMFPAEIRDVEEIKE